MASCYLTSHVEISTTDRVVGGRTIKQGQALIVSDQLVGGGTAEIDICKVTQYVEGLLECVPVTNDLSGITGTDGQVFAGQPRFVSVTANFINNSVVAGDFIVVTSGDDNTQGTWRIVQVLSNSGVELNKTFDLSEEDLSWTLIRNERPPDYSQVLRALPVSMDALLPHLRYFPMFGPGDHANNTMSTTAGTDAVVDVNASFDDIDRPIPTDGTGYIEILTGSDAGFHNILSVQHTTLQLSANLNFTAQNIAYRVRLVSPHATHVMVSDWGSDKVAIPIQDTFEIKVAGAVRSLADAQELDASSEIPDTTRAADLFGALGPFVGCFRLQRGASETQGLPLDDRVLIPAKPWRGHAVDGVLFFAANGSKKYDLSDPDEPVLPIRWSYNMYRLEMSIGREAVQEPTIPQLCLVN